MNDILFSSYDNQLLAEYRVQCSPGQLAFINITVMDIEEGNCIDDEGNSRYLFFYKLNHRSMAPVLRVYVRTCMCSNLV